MSPKMFMQLYNDIIDPEIGHDEFRIGSHATGVMDVTPKTPKTCLRIASARLQM